MWRGTLMRHVVLSGAIATGPRRMVHLPIPGDVAHCSGIIPPTIPR
jgi:hypothetical protein